MTAVWLSSANVRHLTTSARWQALAATASTRVSSKVSSSKFSDLNLLLVQQGGNMLKHLDNKAFPTVLGLGLVSTPWLFSPQVLPGDNLSVNRLEFSLRLQLARSTYVNV